MLTNMTKPNSNQKPTHHAQELETLGLMASSIAHDFNNLLTSIVSQASLALAKLPPEEAARSHVEKAIKAAEHATTLTHQLLSYAKGDRSRIEVIDLNQVISDQVGLLHMAFLEGVALQLDLAPHLPSIEANRGQIQQVVMNLVINAAEAMRSHSDAIMIRTGKEVLSPSDDVHRFASSDELLVGEFVYVQISDTGTGIDETTLNHIFDPFFTTKPKGRGLGLATIMETISRYRGGITVESQVGQGTTFTVFFPSRYNDLSG
jgi:signal transduction histidine kinase